MSDEIKITFLDIGVGDATSITFDEGGARRCILVDGGDTRKAAKVVRDHLAGEQVDAIDLLVATHFDQDHIRGLIYLLRDMADGQGPLGGLQVGDYWGPMPLSSTLGRPAGPRGIGRPSRFVIQSLRQNEKLLKEVRRCISDPEAIRFPSLADPPPVGLFGRLEIEFLSPAHQVPAEEVQKAALSVPIRSSVARADRVRTIDDLRRAIRHLQAASGRRADHTANNLSIVIRLSPTERHIRRWKILLPGDAEEESWGSMATRGQGLAAGILKVSHHGSTNGTPPWIIPEIQPEYSVISAGQRHGHPTEAVYRSLLHGNNQVYVTEKNMGSKLSGCQGFECPKSGRPGSISFVLKPDNPEVTITPDSACTEALQGEFGS